MAWQTVARAEVQRLLMLDGAFALACIASDRAASVIPFVQFFSDTGSDGRGAAEVAALAAARDSGEGVADGAAAIAACPPVGVLPIEPAFPR
jgi:hypothetical protein